MSELVVSITGCARCHGDGHENLAFMPLTHPVVESSGTELTHWAPCPTNGEPILLGTTDSKRCAGACGACRCSRD